MQNLSRPAALLGTLAATWTLAAAQPGSLTITSNEGLTDFRTVSVNLNDSTSAVEAIAVSENFGLVSPGEPRTVGVPSLAFSASPANQPYNNDYFLGIGLTTGGDLVTATGATNESGGRWSNFGVDYDAVKSFVATGAADLIRTLIDGSVRFVNNPPTPYSDFITENTMLRETSDPGILRAFSDTTSQPRIIGSLAYAAPVPEPASMAVVGLGLAALRRRRRR